MSSAVLLRFGSVRLLFPQREVLSLSSVFDVQTLDCAPGSVGWVSHASQTWPVYDLSVDFRLSNGMSPDRRVCAVFPHAQGYLGLMCDEARILSKPALDVHEVPPVMRHPNAPFSALLTLDNTLVCMSSAVELTAFLQAAALVALEEATI